MVKKNTFALSTNYEQMQLGSFQLSKKQQSIFWHSRGMNEACIKDRKYPQAIMSYFKLSGVITSVKSNYSAENDFSFTERSP